MYESNIQPSKMQFIGTWENYNYIHIHACMLYSYLFLDKRQKHQKDLSNVSKAQAMTEN